MGTLKKEHKGNKAKNNSLAYFSMRNGSPGAKKMNCSVMQRDISFDKRAVARPFVKKGKKDHTKKRSEH